MPDRDYQVMVMLPQYLEVLPSEVPQFKVKTSEVPDRDYQSPSSHGNAPSIFRSITKHAEVPQFNVKTSEVPQCLIEITKDPQVMVMLPQYFEVLPSMMLKSLSSR